MPNIFDLPLSYWLTPSSRHRRRLYQYCRALLLPDWAVHYQSNQTDLATTHPEPRIDISILVSCYNYEVYVKAALESIFTAELKHLSIEIIVVNDASTDQSAKVLQACLKASPYRFHLYTPAWNVGLSRVRNLALEKAHGEYVFILDADNLIHPTALSRLHHLAQTHEAAAVYGPIETFSEDSSEVGLISDRPFDPQALFHGNYIDAMALFKRSNLLEAGGYDVSLLPTIGGWENYALWLEFAQRALPVEFEKEVIGYYRIKTDSMVKQITPAEMAIAMKIFQTRYHALRSSLRS